MSAWARDTPKCCLLHTGWALAQYGFRKDAKTPLYLTDILQKPANRASPITPLLNLIKCHLLDEPRFRVLGEPAKPERTVGRQAL
jgi:hypothetical protein